MNYLILFVLAVAVMVSTFKSKFRKQKREDAAATFRKGDRVKFTVGNHTVVGRIAVVGDGYVGVRRGNVIFKRDIDSVILW